MKYQWEEEPCKVECQVAKACPFLPHEEPADRTLMSPPLKLFLIAPTEGTPLCMVVQAKQARCTTTTLEEQTLEESETEEAPQSVNCPSPTQHQTGDTSLGWVNEKLHAFTQMFSGASLLDQR